jgi:hypothetical protein
MSRSPFETNCRRCGKKILMVPKASDSGYIPLDPATPIYEVVLGQAWLVPAERRQMCLLHEHSEAAIGFDPDRFAASHFATCPHPHTNQFTSKKGTGHGTAATAEEV